MNRIETNTTDKPIVKVIVNILLAIDFHSLTSFNPINPRKNAITVILKTIFNGWIPMILVKNLKKFVENIAMKNIGIQNKESIKDPKLTLSFIRTSPLKSLISFHTHLKIQLIEFLNNHINNTPLALKSFISY